MSLTPQLSIIIPTKDRKEIFCLTINSVLESIKGIDCEVIVVNDSANEIELPEDKKSAITILQGECRGVARARNAGFAASSGNVILFLDNDMIINHAALTACLNYIIAQKTDCCINVNWEYPPQLLDEINKHAFGRYLIRNGFHSYEGKAWLNKTFTTRGIHETNSIASAFLMMPRATFIHSGGYNHSFSFAGFEDHEFAKRLLQSGVKAYILSDKTVFHNERDYVQLKAFLERKRRSSYTRRQGAEMGEKDMELSLGKAKKFFYSFLSQFSFILFFSIKLIPDRTFFDPIYNRIVNRLLGLYIYKGYYLDFRK